MGLDITAYSDITLVDEAEDGEEGVAFLYANRDFPNHNEGIEGYYRYGSEYDFRAGSYSGYNEWRRQLARLAGYASDRAVWEQPDLEGPFVELINFSDCEGVIGPKLCAKLAKDFADFQDAADSVEDGLFFTELFNHWRTAFEIGADGGAVQFH